jgi:hypothetical protein
MKTAIQINESIPANDTVNVLSGKRFENVSRTGFLALAQTGAAAGLEAELYVGTNNALEKSDVGAANRVPQFPEDLVVDEVDAFAGQKIQLNITNTTGAPVVYQAKLVLDDNVQMVR